MTKTSSTPSAFSDGDVIAFSRACHWWKPTTWLSWRIQATTRSPWNHVGLLRWNGRHEYWEVIEAKFRGGVSRTPLVYYERHDLMLAVGTKNLSLADRCRVIKFALSTIGAKYDALKLAKIRALQLILGNAEAANEVRSGEADNLYICSELVIRAYRQIGIDLSGDFAGPGAVIEATDQYAFWNGRRWLA